MKYDNHLLLYFLIIMLCGCGDINFSTKGYKKAVLSGLKQIPEASQMDEIFGKKNVDHSISYNGSLKNSSNFYSTAYFGGRYTLTMAVPVRMGPSFDQVLEVLGEPKFYMDEVIHVNYSPSTGKTSPRFNTSFKCPSPFDVATWNKIYNAKGDFSVVDIQVKKDQPVKNFSEYEKGMRRNLIKVER